MLINLNFYQKNAFFNNSLIILLADTIFHYHPGERERHNARYGVQIILPVCFLYCSVASKTAGWMRFLMD
ncbi:hypothetical protein BN440_pEA290036 (plasmid) [Erwinia amylovora MR1]|nr:hypothetical protein BN440_pEA290036 [Erwinia amylovora MR1]